MLQRLKVTSYALLILLLLVLPSQAVAQCNTQDACAAAAQAKGLILGGNGYAFSGSYGTKGCYSYNGGKYIGMAYFGTGGSPAQMAAAPAAPKYRISCGPNAAPAAAAFCEPVERYRILKDTARHSDYTVWAVRCSESGFKGTCGNGMEWPIGDGGRCETTTADTVAAPDVNPNAVPEMTTADTGPVCHPNERISGMYNTDRHTDWEYGIERCAREGVNADVCATGWGKGRCQWGSPPQLGPLDTSVAAKSQAIEDCKAAVAATFNDLRQNVVTHDIVASLKTFPISESARSAYLREQRKQPSSVANSARAAELVELRTCR